MNTKQLKEKLIFGKNTRGNRNEKSKKQLLERSKG